MLTCACGKGNDRGYFTAVAVAICGAALCCAHIGLFAVAQKCSVDCVGCYVPFAVDKSLAWALPVHGGCHACDIIQLFAGSHLPVCPAGLYMHDVHLSLSGGSISHGGKIMRDHMRHSISTSRQHEVQQPVTPSLSVVCLLCVPCSCAATLLILVCCVETYTAMLKLLSICCACAAAARPLS